MQFSEKNNKERKVNENDFQLVGKTLELVQFIILYKTFEFSNIFPK